VVVRRVVLAVDVAPVTGDVPDEEPDHHRDLHEPVELVQHPRRLPAMA
jgi:hypothetical protein